MPSGTGGALLVVPHVEGLKGFDGPSVALPDKLRESLVAALKRKKSSGKAGETCLLNLDVGTGETAVLVSGIGRLPFTGKEARKYAARGIRTAIAEHYRKAVVLLPALDDGSVGEVLQAVTEGAMLGGYRFIRYKGEAERTGEVELSSVTVVVGDGHPLRDARSGIRRGRIYSEATGFARELVNEPAGEMTPARLVEAARQAAASDPDRISLKVYDKAGLERLGAGGLLAVARGSDEPPFMVHLTYRPEAEARARIVLVGKGITFDSGGLSLKPSQAMEDMKIDMSGAAAVLGAMSVMAELAPQVEVHAVAGLCENMPSGKAVKPGDIIRVMDGKTVEVLNTDAEGRVTLADTLHFGAMLEPDFMVDLATLTGACMVALGQEVSGLMSNSDGLSERLLEASAAEGEMLWRLPLPEEYEELIKSPVADLKNISGSKYGGAITAGLFLKQFVGRTDWAHLDIAGPAWAEKDTVPHQPRGATGFGVRTVLRFVESL